MALAATGKFAWRAVPAYLVAQFTGAVVGAFTIAGVLGPEASKLGLGAASYGTDVWVGRALFAEAVGCALADLRRGRCDRSPSRARMGWYGLSALLCSPSCSWWGLPLAARLNPARYIGPMIAAAALGHHEAWSQIPVYLIGEFAGAAIGAAVYVVLARIRVAVQLSHHHVPELVDDPQVIGSRAAPLAPGLYGAGSAEMDTVVP